MTHLNIPEAANDDSWSNVITLHGGNDFSWVVSDILKYTETGVVSANQNIDHLPRIAKLNAFGLKLVNGENIDATWEELDEILRILLMESSRRIKNSISWEAEWEVSIVDIGKKMDEVIDYLEKNMPNSQELTMLQTWKIPLKTAIQAPVWKEVSWEKICSCIHRAMNTWKRTA